MAGGLGDRYDGVGEPAASWGNLLAPLRHPAAAGCLQLASPLPLLALLVLACELLGGRWNTEK